MASHTAGTQIVKKTDNNPCPHSTALLRESHREKKTHFVRWWLSADKGRGASWAKGQTSLLLRVR